MDADHDPIIDSEEDEHGDGDGKSDKEAETVKPKKKPAAAAKLVAKKPAARGRTKGAKELFLLLLFMCKSEIF